MKKTKHAVMTEQVQQRLRAFDVAPDLEEVAMVMLKHGVPREEALLAIGYAAFRLTLSITCEIFDKHGVLGADNSEAIAILQGIHVAEADAAAKRALELGQKKLGTWLQEVAVSSVKH
jgi:hypothetical protein